MNPLWAAAGPTAPSLVAQSVTLPTLGTGEAIRVAQATQVPYQVTLRVIGPPGEWAAFSFDPTELNTPQASPLIPLGNTIIVPAGKEHTMGLRPYQVIYAMGSTSTPFPVCVSVSMSERPGRR